MRTGSLAELTMTFIPITDDSAVVVHVSAAAGLRRVQHHEHVVVVDVHLRQGAALEAVVHGAGVEAEDVGQDVLGVRIADRHVDPDQAVLACQSGGQQLRGAAPRPLPGHQPHVHHRHPHRTAVSRRRGCRDGGRGPAPPRG